MNNWVEFLELHGLSYHSDGRTEVEITKDGGVWVRLLEGSNTEFEVMRITTTFYSSGVEDRVEVTCGVVDVMNEKIDHGTMEFMRNVSLEDTDHHLFAKECFLRYSNFPVFFNEIIKVDDKGKERLKEIFDEFLIDYSDYII